jgi:hypothetical protein
MGLTRHIALYSNRRGIIAAFVGFGLVVLHARAAETERPVVAPSRSQQVASLRDRLVVGLQARLKSEVAFVELVALKVRQGKLPQRVVDQTFFWARDRASITRNGYSLRPIVYFRPAMIARSNRLRVDLTP